MQKKVKNVLIGTSVLSLLGTAIIVGNTINNKNEKVINNPKELKGVNSNVKTTTSTLLNQEVVQSIGWDTKTMITLADWKTQAPNVTETFQSFMDNTLLTSIEIPSSIKVLGENTFSSNTNLSNVKFEDNSKLTTIGKNAFGGTTALNIIEIPKSVAYLNNMVFDNSGISNIIFDPNSVLNTIGSYAFGPRLLSIKIPQSTKVIQKSAFSNATNLNEIVMPSNFKTWGVIQMMHYGFTQAQWNSVSWDYPPSKATILTKQVIKNIGWDTKTTITLEDWKTHAPNIIEISADAFANNIILTSIQIPDTINSIANLAFSGTTSLTTISMHISMKTPALNYGFSQEQWDTINWISNLTGTTLNLNMIKKLGWDTKTEITLADWEMIPNVTEISADAFADNIILTSIEIPNNIVTIAETSFSGTTSLTNISMNIKLKKDTLSYGFSQEQWDTIVWTYSPINATILTANDLILIGWDTKTTITLEDWKMAPNVVKIGSAFKDNTTLTSIEIPRNIEILGNSSFNGASALNIVIFESNSQLKSIEKNAFKNTTALKNIRLGLNTKLTTISDLAFADSGITMIDLPTSIKNIGKESFLNSKLTNISMDYSVAKESLTGLYGLSQEQWDNVIWKNIPSTGSINSFIAKQLLKTNLKIDWEQISTYNGIDANAFSDTNIISITIDSGFTIDSQAFANTPSLTDINLNPIYKKDALSYGLSQEQWNSVDWFSSSTSNDYNEIITIVGITASLVVILSLAVVIYISLKKRNN